MAYPYQAVVVVDNAKLLRHDGSNVAAPRNTALKVYAEDKGLGYVTAVINGNSEAGRMRTDSYKPVDTPDGMTVAEFTAAITATKAKKTANTTKADPAKPKPKKPAPK